MLDYLIIGQGTAGTMIAHFLENTNATFKIIDDGNKTSSSIVAAGIVNPITGKRFVKSWRVDEFIPFAEKTYRKLSKQLKTELIVNRNIVRILLNEGQENDWLAQTAALGYQKYLIDHADTKEFQDHFIPAFSYGEIQQSFQVKLFELLPKYKDYLISQDKYIKDYFDYSQLTIQEEKIIYKNIEAKQIIFAEGYKVIENPYFKVLPFAPVKGEILMVKIHGQYFQKMLKHKLFIVPMYDDIYWVGSNYDWDFKDQLPSASQGQKLKEILDEIILTPYTIIDHKAGIRPSFKNRRPIIIHHPKYKNMILFNGLGAKGTSLAPYWANHLVEHLINGKPLDKEVQARKYVGLLDPK